MISLIFLVVSSLASRYRRSVSHISRSTLRRFGAYVFSAHVIGFFLAEESTSYSRAEPRASACLHLAIVFLSLSLRLLASVSPSPPLSRYPVTFLFCSTPSISLPLSLVFPTFFLPRLRSESVLALDVPLLRIPSLSFRRSSLTRRPDLSSRLLVFQQLLLLLLLSHLPLPLPSVFTQHAPLPRHSCTAPSSSCLAAPPRRHHHRRRFWRCPPVSHLPPTPDVAPGE